MTLRLRWYLFLILLLAHLFVVPTLARADTWLVATVASYHTNREVEHNERNWGLGFEQDIWQDSRLVGGFYKNSYYRQSQYLGITYMPFRLGPVRLGAMFGGVTGYDPGVQPIVLPTISIEGKRWGANLGVAPSSTKGVGVLGLQIKYNLE